MTNSSPGPFPSLALAADCTLLRHSQMNVRYLHVRVTAPAAVREASRPAVHAAFCLDRSGSMGGRPLHLAKQAVHTALGRLVPADRFAVVTFDDVVEVVTPATFASSAATATAHDKLRHVDARGSTALCAGWLTACGEIAPTSGPGGDLAATARCFLLTDGQANVGETNLEVLAKHAYELRLRGVRTVTFGLGDGFNEELLQGLAAAGGGHFYFVEDAANIGDFFTSELGEALDVVSREVRLTLSAPGVKCEPLTTYGVEPMGDRVVVRLGDLVSDQVIDLVVKLTFPGGEIGRSIEVLAQVSADGRAAATPENAVDHLRTQEVARFTFAPDHTANHQPRNRQVDRQVASVYAAHARRIAVARNRDGDLLGAEDKLLSTAKYIQRYAHGDEELFAIADALVEDAKRYSAPMMEMERKRAYASATSQMKGRDTSGRARKS